MGQSNIIFSTCGGSPQGLWPGGRRVAPLHSNPFSTFKNSLQTVPDAISHAVGGPETSYETVPIIAAIILPVRLFWKWPRTDELIVF